MQPPTRPDPSEPFNTRTKLTAFWAAITTLLVAAGGLLMLKYFST